MPGCPVTGNGGPRPSGWTRGRAVLSVTTRGRPREAGVPGSPRGRCVPRAPRVESGDAAPFGQIARPPWRGSRPPNVGSPGPGPATGRTSAIAPGSMPGSLQPGSAGGTPECASGPRAPRPGARPHRAPGGGGGGTGGPEVQAALHGAGEPAPAPPPAPGRLLLMARRAGAAGSRAAQRRGRAEQACPGPEPLTIGPPARAASSGGGCSTRRRPPAPG